jgi:hypothetical protein
MFGSQVLDVGVGLAMLFAFMSLIATALNEAIEAVLKARANHLEQGIRNIFNDPNGDKITQKFFNNPLISILYSGSYDLKDLGGTTVPDGDAQRETLSSGNGGGAPIDAAPPNVNTGPAPVKAPLLAASSRSRSIPWWLRQNLPSYIPSASFALAVLNLAAEGAASTAALVRAKVDNDKGTLDGSPQLKAVVLQALASSQDDLAKAQKFLENWFDAAMDRVSGWYKRRSQIILFFIGLFAAVVLNVDTIAVTRSLISDPALRQAVVAHAADRAKKHADSTNAASPDPAKPADPGPAKPTDPDFNESRNELMSIGYPIGWANLPQLPPDPTEPTCNPLKCIFKIFAPGFYPGVVTIAPMFLGWLITAFAITLGAPFWFDLLGKFMQVRATTKPQPADQGAQSPAAATPAQKAADIPAPSAGLDAADQLALAPLIASGQAGFVAEQWADGSDRGTL